MQGMEFGEPSAALKRPLPEGSEQIIANPLETGEPQRPTKKRASNPAEANQKHIKTEQARRDKISAGFNALQDLLPSRERVEKAALLNQAAGYITQLQAVLSAVLTNGTITKLPDDLQWQIRTLLPRKEAGASRLPHPSGQSSPQPGGSLMMVPEGQAADPAQAIPASGPLNLSFLPLMTQGTAQAPSPAAVSTKEMSRDEGVLMAQVQAQLSQMQQQAAAAQHLQSWQQALQAIQLQSVLNTQQTGQEQSQFPWAAAPAGPPMFKQPSGEPSASPAPVSGTAAPADQPVEPQPNPSETFTELLSTAKEEPDAAAPATTQTGLQQLADVASNDTSPKAAPGSQGKARKAASKGKKGASASKAAKPEL